MATWISVSNNWVSAFNQSTSGIIEYSPAPGLRLFKLECIREALTWILVLHVGILPGYANYSEQIT